jgi:ASCH domain-containing protein
MKAISIRQPWAHFIVKGYKDIENRTWKTNYRGPILIHAGVNVETDHEFVATLCKQEGIPAPDLKKLPRGGIVGYATIVDCVVRHSSPWFEGDYGFVLEDAGDLEFYPKPGELSIWESGLEFVE